jgi:hypothetical protein
MYVSVVARKKTFAAIPGLSKYVMPDRVVCG